MGVYIAEKKWNAKEADCTDQSSYRSRREIIRSLGLGAVGLTTMACTSRSESMAAAYPAIKGPLDTIPDNAPWSLFPAAKNESFKVPERALTDRIAAATYNNFYEFDPSSKEIWQLTGAYNPFPWSIEISGLVEKPFTIGLDDLLKKVSLEERLLRFRCVEAWSMTIPWTGFVLKELISMCKPLSKASYVKFTSVNKPSELPGQKDTPYYPWPYYEGLRMDEAMNDMSFVAIGAYGEPLPKQHGSPLRMILPWKYGYKGGKAINKIEFVDKQPGTFWLDLQPKEYPFISNINPKVAHPRWSQASERFIASASSVTRIPTQLFNGYEEWVSDLYPNELR